MKKDIILNGVNIGELAFDKDNMIAEIKERCIDNTEKEQLMISAKQAADIGFDGIEFRGKQPNELTSLSFREYAKLYGADEPSVFIAGVPRALGRYRTARQRAENIGRQLFSIRYWYNR